MTPESKWWKGAVLAGSIGVVAGGAGYIGYDIGTDYSERYINEQQQELIEKNTASIAQNQKTLTELSGTLGDYGTSMFNSFNEEPDDDLRFLGCFCVKDDKDAEPKSLILCLQGGRQCTDKARKICESLNPAYDC